jgi:hypothetical protein
VHEVPQQEVEKTGTTARRRESLSHLRTLIQSVRKFVGSITMVVMRMMLGSMMVIKHGGIKVGMGMRILPLAPS